MSDLIDRQAAIVALCKAGCDSGYCGASCDDVKAIEQLPSAQPKKVCVAEIKIDGDEMQKCVDKAVNRILYDAYQPLNQWKEDRKAIIDLPSVHETHEEHTETHACDCVSGVAAIIAAIEAVDEWDGGYNVQRANMIRDAIKALPSAQPRRLNGEWIEDGYNHYKAVCSECGEPCATYIMGKPRDKYCKWCGADMRGEDDA